MSFRYFHVLFLQCSLFVRSVCAHLPCYSCRRHLVKHAVFYRFLSLHFTILGEGKVKKREREREPRIGILRIIEILAQKKLQWGNISKLHWNHLEIRTPPIGVQIVSLVGPNLILISWGVISIFISAAKNTTIANPYKNTSESIDSLRCVSRAHERLKRGLFWYRIHEVHFGQKLSTQGGFCA